jgi:tetratricopeptide (TPR) repeat protein
LLREVEPPRAWRTVATIAISAVAGALGATAVFKLGAEPFPPPPAPQQVADARPLVCPPVLIVHEPAQEPPPGARRAAADASDAGVQLAQAASPQAPPPHAEKPPARTTRAAASRPARRKEKPAAQSGAQSEVDKGERALRKGQLDEAMSAFQAALARDERFAPAIRGLAMVHMTQGREADAKREYERYLRLAPDAPDASRIRKVVANLGAQ